MSLWLPSCQHDNCFLQCALASVISHSCFFTSVHSASGTLEGNEIIILINIYILFTINAIGAKMEEGVNGFG